MKNIITIIFIVVLSFTTITQARINVVASIPDIGWFAQEIGQDKINLTVLATGKEDLHSVPVRPSFIPIIARADLLLTLGLGAEHAWLDALARESRNRELFPGNSGWIELHTGIKIKGIPEVIDRSKGEQHPRGNPHYNLSPASADVFINNIVDAFSNADPDNMDFYMKNGEKLLEKTQSFIEELKELAKPLDGVNIVAYHAETIYLCEFYGMNEMGFIEPKPGIPPNPAHLGRLKREVDKTDAKLLIYSQAHNPRSAARFSNNLGLSPVEISAMFNGTDYFSYHKHNLNVLLKALETYKKD